MLRQEFSDCLSDYSVPLMCGLQASPLPSFATPPVLILGPMVSSLVTGAVTFLPPVLVVISTFTTPSTTCKRFNPQYSAHRAAWTTTVLPVVPWQP